MSHFQPAKFGHSFKQSTVFSRMGLIATLQIFTLIMAGCMGPTSPPVKVNLALSSQVTPEQVSSCVAALNLNNPFTSSVEPYSNRGFGVEIAGKDLLLTGEEINVWEKVQFFIDVEPLKDNIRVLFVNINGSSTRSASKTMPPSGSRWEPFGSTKQAYVSSKSISIFHQLSKCFDPEGITV